MARKHKVNYSIEPKLQASIEYLLQTQGTYSPVEFLIHEGFLKYENYEAWRYGKKAYLEQVVDGAVDALRHRLKQAALWLQHLGMQAEVHSYRCWGVKGDGPLCFCEKNSDEVVALYQTHFTRLKSNTSQLDLFFDDHISVIIELLRESLLERRISETKKVLNDLFSCEPEHRFIKPGKLFCEAIKSLESGQYGKDVEQDVMVLECSIMPFVHELAGRRARDIIAPLWHVLSETLSEHPFDSESPKLHSSWVLSELLDWPRVREAVLAVPDWQIHPVLCARLAKALYQMKERLEAISLWCQLCWCFPDYAQQVMGDPLLPDPAVRLAWLEWQDVGVKPALSVSHFPAWLLLNEPELAQDLVIEGDCSQDGVVSFNLVRQLLLTRAEKNKIDRLLASQGEALRVAHPGLHLLYRECFSRKR